MDVDKDIDNYLVDAQAWAGPPRYGNGLLPNQMEEEGWVWVSDLLKMHRLQKLETCNWVITFFSIAHFYHNTN